MYTYKLFDIPEVLPDRYPTVIVPSRIARIHAECSTRLRALCIDVVVAVVADADCWAPCLIRHRRCRSRRRRSRRCRPGRSRRRTAAVCCWDRGNQRCCRLIDRHWSWTIGRCRRRFGVAAVVVVVAEDSGRPPNYPFQIDVLRMDCRRLLSFS